MPDTTRMHTIDVIAGDGIGPEVIAPARACVDALGSSHGFTVRWRERDWGSDRFRRTGSMMPVDGVEQLADGDGILLGAVGSPDIDDVTTLWGLLIPIRRAFDQYVNLRPTRSLSGVVPPVPAAAGMDLLIVRENTEGEYSTVGGRFGSGAGETAVQEAIFTRAGIARVTRYAAGLASARSRDLVSATKSNGIIHSMPFWDAVVAEVVAEEFPEVRVESVLIDALAARLVQAPQAVSVLVASNLFGDILSDLAAAVAGSIGVAPSANLNPERRFPSLFEPVHGSAPDIAGQGVANPIGAMWAAAMMLDHLGEASAARALEAAFEGALAAGVATRDLGGTATTTEFSAAVLERLAALSTAMLVHAAR